MEIRTAIATVLFLGTVVTVFPSGTDESQGNKNGSFHLLMLAARAEDPGLRFIEQDGPPTKVSYVNGPLLQYRKGDMTYYDRPGVFVDPQTVAVGVGGKLVILDAKGGPPKYVEGTKSVTNIFTGQAPDTVYFIDGRKLSKYDVRNSRVISLTDLGEFLEKIGNWYSTTNIDETNDGRLNLFSFTFSIDEASNHLFANPHFLDLQIFSYGLGDNKFRFVVAGVLPHIFYLDNQPKLYFSDTNGIASTDLDGAATPEYLFRYRYRVSNFKMLSKTTCYIQTEDVFGFFPQASGILGFKMLRDGKLTWFKNHVYPDDLYLINAD